MNRLHTTVIMICLFAFTAGVVYAQEDNTPAQSEKNGAPPVSSTNPVESNYKNFSFGQRIGTWALNAFTLPGLGSCLIMHDILGGTIQLVAGGAGTGLTIAGGVLIAGKTFNFVFTDQWGKEGSFRDSLAPYILMIVGGGVLYLGNFIFNIARSAAYDRPRPKTALGDLSAWSVAVLPGENGVEAVQLACTLRY